MPVNILSDFAAIFITFKSMRKVCFIENNDIKKVILFSAQADEVYVFCYDTWQDAASIGDYLYETLEDAEEYCRVEYNIKPSDWIDIADPQQGCQQDFILPTKVKGKEEGNPQWGCFQSLYNGKWMHVLTPNNRINNTLCGTTGNERLFLSGLVEEFDIAIKRDKEKARKILKSLKFDDQSIGRILYPPFGASLFDK